MSGPSVLFVGHDASRTGAPVAMGAALRWLRAHTDAQLDAVLLAGGPLVEVYRSEVPTRVLGGRASAALTGISAAARSVGASVPSWAEAVPLRGVPSADVVVANTLASLEVGVRLADRGPSRARLVAHVHELDGVAERVLPRDPRRRAELLDRVDAFAAVGTAVATMLVERWGVPATRVHVVDGCIEAPRPTDAELAAGRRSLAVEPGRPIVLAVGALHRRKGPERFVDLMSLLASHPDAPQGRWLGGDAASAVGHEARADIARAVDPSSIRLVPAVDHAPACLAAADLVVSTAIEDPYPLTVLEAGALGVPVIGYDSGGLREVLTGCGQADSIVPVGDLLGLAAVARRLLDDPGERARRGADLSGWVRSTHLVDQVLPRLWAVIAP